MTEIVINNRAQLSAAMTRIAALDFSKPVVITVKRYHKHYSAQQRKLYWSWMDPLCEHTGDDKQDMHTNMKKRFLVPILRRDDEGYAEMIAAVVAAGDPKIGRWVVENTSITKTNTKQMAEYMDQVMVFAGRELGVRLESPDSLNLQEQVA